MASGNTNYNMTNTQTGAIGTTSNFGHTSSSTHQGNIDTTSTLGHTYDSTGHRAGSALGHTTGSTFGTTNGSSLETTAPSLSSTTMGHTTTGHTTGLKEGGQVTKGTGLKDEFVGGMKETAGTVFCSQKLKAAGHEQKILGKEEVAAAKVEKGLVGDKGTLGTAAGARALDETDKAKFDKKAEKDQLKVDKKAAKERAKAEKLTEKDHTKLEKDKGHKFDKGHKTEIHEPARTEPFVGRVDRLNANHGNPHVEPHVAAMMNHGMPIESQTIIQQPIVTGVAVDKTMTSYEKPLVSGAFEQRDVHEKTILDKPFTGGIARETRMEEVIRPKQDMPFSQTFTSTTESFRQPIGSTQPMGSNFDNKFGSQSDRLNPKFDNMNLNQGNTRLNVSPRAERLNVSPRNQLNISPRRCDAARLETSPRHMAHV